MPALTLSLLTESDLHQLHGRTLTVFEKTGIKILHKEARARLRKAGAQVDEQSQVVRFPHALVGELLAQAPSTAVYEGINGQRREVGGTQRVYGSLVTDPWINDYRSGRRRPRLDDVRRHTIIGESLDRISAMMRMQFPVTDIPEPDGCYKTMEVFLCHMTKHVNIYPTGIENAKDWIGVYECIADALGLDLREHPLVSVAMAVTSPLQIHEVNAELIKLAIDYRFPIISTVCPMAGSTSPYSVAGTMLLANVEALVPVLIAQVYRPGHPVMYGGIGPSETDLQTGHDLYYKAEKMLFKTMACELGRFYRLPVSGSAGGTLTCRPDVQNGAESMAYLLASHLSGQHFIGGIGSMDNANGMSAEQILMQCGLIDMAEYLVRGVDLSDHKLALDSIHALGPGGNYLMDDLTLELMRSDEFFRGGCFDFSGGYDPDAPGMFERAHASAEALVDGNTSSVPDRVVDSIKTYFHGKYRDKKVSAL